MLDELLDQVRGGRSTVLVMRGEAGVGKTALAETSMEKPMDDELIRLCAAPGRRRLPADDSAVPDLVPAELRRRQRLG